VLEFAVPGYFFGFPIAGALFATASHLNNRMLRYAVTGLLCGTAIYGVMGISVAFIDGTALDWNEIATTAGVLGCFFALLGFVMGALDEWRERRRAARPAS
jgi:H+/Cl- antiporter ClcA